MAYMDPLRSHGQDVRYKNGTPIVMSHAQNSIVAVAPKTGPTGRYEISDRIAFMVAIRNQSAARIEVSEQSIRVQANAQLARVVTGAQLEDEIRRGAAWAQAMNAFSAGLQTLDASFTGGTTTHTGQVGGQRFSGQSHNPNQQREAIRAVSEDASSNAKAIRAEERDRIGEVARMLLRNTLDPGESVEGFVVVDTNRLAACGTLLREAAGYGYPAEYKPGPCKLWVVVTVANEVHTFDFAEVF